MNEPPSINSLPASHREALRSFANYLSSHYPPEEVYRAKYPDRSPLLDRLRQTPELILSQAGLPPDPWQTALLRSTSDRILMLVTRQGGKTQTASGIALKKALFKPGLILLLSPTQRQSSELFRDKLLPLWAAVSPHVPVTSVRESALQMELSNGSRIVALPGDEKTIRGYSNAKCLIVDEASRVEDALYYSIRPMLAVSQGTLVALSTPWGKRGWFYDAWRGEEKWERVRVTADQCPRITSEFLAEERREIGDRWYRQEYECSFEDTVDAVFLHDDIEAMVTPGIEPLRI